MIEKYIAISILVSFFLFAPPILAVEDSKTIGMNRMSYGESLACWIAFLVCAAIAIAIFYVLFWAVITLMK